MIAMIGRIALVVFGVVAILSLCLSAFGLEVGPSLATMAQGAFGNSAAWGRTLIRACPLTLAGLGIVIAWRAGVYNIGGEGQYVLGGIGGAFVAQAMGFAAGSTVPILVVGSLSGAALGAFAGWLSVKRGIQIVISTILLNFVALLFLEWCLRGPLQEPKRQIFVSQTLPDSVMFLRFDRGSDLHSGVLVAVLAVGLAWFFLNRTWPGFRLKVAGESPGAARAAKIDVGRSHIGAMAISGGLCGLAGVVDYLGVTGRLADGFSQGWGFLAIPVALLGGLNPLGAAGAAVLFGSLFAGSEVLKRTTPIGSSLVPAVQGVVVLAFLALGVWFARKREYVDESD
jgi:simple sugar transport system permease protein